MATPLSFKREFMDAGIVSSAKFWAFGKDPVVSPLQVKFAAGGNKFSCCAAYAFTCPKNEKFPDLKVVFCAKLHSKIFRRDPSNLSRWYIWQPIGKSGCMVLSADDAREQYGFDIFKFFKTSEFKRGQAEIKRLIEVGLKGAKKLYKEIGKEDLDEYSTFVKSLEEAKEIVDDVPSFEDKSYRLVDYDKFIRELQSGGFGEELKQRARAFKDWRTSSAKRFMDRVKINDLKAGEKARAEDKKVQDND